MGDLNIFRRLRLAALSVAMAGVGGLATALPATAGDIVVLDGGDEGSLRSRESALRAKQYQNPGETNAQARRLYIQRGTDDRSPGEAARLNALRAAKAAGIDPDEIPADAVIVILDDDAPDNLTTAELNALKARKYAEGVDVERGQRVLILKPEGPADGTAAAAARNNMLVLDQAQGNSEGNPARVPKVIFVDPKKSDAARKVMVISNQARRAMTEDNPSTNDCLPSSTTVFGIIDENAGGKSRVAVEYKDTVNLDECR